MWFLAPVPDPYYKYAHKAVNQYIKETYPPNYHITTEVEEGLQGIEGQNNFTTNNIGLRGDYLEIPKPENEFRIFMIGGSTAECLYLDDSKSISAVLQKELNKHIAAGLSIKVYNAARSAAKSDDWISILVHRIVHLEPDMVIIFDTNDLFVSMDNYDYLHFLKEKPKEKFPIFRFLATEFQIPRRIYYIVKRISPSDEELLENITAKTGYKKMIKKAREGLVSNLKPRTDLSSFERNLRSIIGIAKANRIELIFTTAQATWNSPDDPEAKNWQWMFYSVKQKVRYREDLMYEALEKYNDIFRTLSIEHSIPILDLTKIIPRSTEYFYDDAHFNVKGADFAGIKLASFILEERLIQH